MFTTLIDIESLLDGYKNQDWLVIDVRYDLANKDAGKKAYLKGHIPGAIYVDLHDDLSRPPATNKGRHPLPTEDTMNSLFSELGINEGTQVIVYDNAFGAFAARLWWMLRHMQHQRVAVLDGGWQAWEAAAAQIDSKNEQLNRSNFKKSARKQELVDIKQIENVDLLIDSREPARYRGELEPIDKAAGHIPGAINRFWKANLAENGCFKEKTQLQTEFEQIFENTPAKESVFYCGSGVTACHNLLAVVHAGLEQPKLYAGSWSEWSSDASNPVATA
ncbi:MAG: sulfurtransferase [Gammaproteobacteria bacterium]|jgi:thiosulfate/3-mercaptopyruvate sulfurtransferase